jgi:hypothetical protein
MLSMNPETSLAVQEGITSRQKTVVQTGTTKPNDEASMKMQIYVMPKRASVLSDG